MNATASPIPDTTVPDTRRLALLLVLLALPYGLALWLVDFPILQDLPGHVEMGWQWRRLLAGDPAVAEYFRARSLPWPNALGPIGIGLLGPTIGYFAAAKLLLTAYAVLWPLALLWFARTVGRNPLVALLLLPTIADASWALGFLNYLLAKPVLLIVLGLGYRWARDGRRRDGVWLLVALVVLFHAHALLWGIGLLACGLAVFALGRDRGRAWFVRLWPLLAALPHAIPFAVAALGAPEGDGHLVLQSLDRVFGHLWDHLGQLSGLPHEEWAWGGSLAVLLWLRFRPPRGAAPSVAPAADSTDSGRRMLLVWLLAFAALYLFGPQHLPGVAIIASRQAVFVWVFAFLLLMPPTLTRRRVALVVAAAVAIVSVHVAALWWQYDRFGQRDMDGFAEMIESLPRGGRLYVYYDDTESKYGAHNAAWHWPKLYAVQRGGLTDDSFAFRTTSFVTVTEAGRRLDDETPDNTLAESPLRAHWDFLLVRAKNEDLPCLLPKYAAWTTPISRVDRWRLYRIHPPAR